MIAPRHFSLGLALLVFFCLPVLADLPPDNAEWRLARDDKGIRIFSRKIAGSDFEAFKAITVLDAPLSNVMAVMADPKSCVEWVHGCVHSEGLDRQSFNNRSAYSVNDLPWPAQDRDYVLHIRTHTETGASESEPPTVVMALSAVPGQRRESSGKVRVEHSDTLYRFYDNGDGRTHMTWIQHTEPNGALPSWLVNSLAIDIPFNSMRSLETLANEPRYRHHELVYNDNGELVDVEDRSNNQALAQ